MPKGLRDTLVTADWGRSKIYRHVLKRKGVSFKEQAQKHLWDIKRPTDMAVDAKGNLYLASWGNAKFKPGDKQTGSIERFHSKAAPQRRARVGVEDASNDGLVEILAGESGKLRFAAQRELLRRDPGQQAIQRIESLAQSDKPLPGRIAALFTLKQLQGEDSHALLEKLAQQGSALRAWALRALAGRPGQRDNVSSALYTSALGSDEPRVRREAIIGLTRLGRADDAEALMAMLDESKLERHLAVRALHRIDAPAPLLAALDQAHGETYRGLLWALKLMHKPAVVDGLISQLKDTSDLERRKPLLIALMRLHYKESPHTGDWWGTRPNTHGPYYDPITWSQSSRIAKVLKRQLLGRPTQTAFMLEQLPRHQIELDVPTKRWLEMADRMPAARSVVIANLSKRDKLPGPAVRFFQDVASDAEVKPKVRAAAFEALQKHTDSPLADRVIAAGAAMLRSDLAQHAALDQAIRQYLAGSALHKQLDRLTALSKSEQAPRRELALAGLMHVAYQAKDASKAQKQRAKERLNAAWQSDSTRPSVLRAAGHVKSEAYRKRVRAQLKARGNQPGAALVYAAKRLSVQLEQNQSEGDQTPVAKLDYPQTVKRVQQASGDPALGRQVFQRAGCVACHTTRDEQPSKGPDLSDIANRYNNKELIESIAKPNASVAQGFATEQFTLRDGSQRLGFVVEEGSDKVVIRNVAGIERELATDQIKKRQPLDRSLMPTGLTNTMSVHEFASLLAYLNELAKEQDQP
jgi:putative heme-binding domain-containing protein